jgi:hypothetical protein
VQFTPAQCLKTPFHQANDVYQLAIPRQYKTIGTTRAVSLMQHICSVFATGGVLRRLKWQA